MIPFFYKRYRRTEYLVSMGQGKLCNKAQALELFKILEKLYPNAETELEFGSNFELLVAVILSAQCTDKRVNEVTDKLFKFYNTPKDFAELEPEVLEKMIFSCGFYRVKAKNIISASRDIITKFSGMVPRTMDELTSLAGVGRKTANVMLAVAFNEDAFAVDTHVFRLSRRLGLASGNTPLHVEREIIELLRGEKLGRLHHLLIFHGRYCCHSRKPDCPACPLTQRCNYYNDKNKAYTSFRNN